jgi:hypothetical protein
MMGYMSTVSETLVLEGPIDQDRITTVARDCILAFVECQVRDRNFKSNLAYMHFTEAMLLKNYVSLATKI